MNLYSKIKKKLNESDDYEANRNDIIKQAAEYLFNDVNGDRDESLPDYEKFTDYYMDLNKRDYNKAVKLAEQALGNYAEHHYYDRDFNNINKSGGLLELNDNHTMWELNNPTLDDSDSAWQLWDTIVTSKIDDFKEETGEELYGCGRSGRHICVEPTFENCLNFDKLQEVQERLEQEAIDEFNNYRDLDESENLKESTYIDSHDADIENRGGKVIYNVFNIRNNEDTGGFQTDYFPAIVKYMNEESQNDSVTGWHIEQSIWRDWNDYDNQLEPDSNYDYYINKEQLKELNTSLKESDTSDITNKIKNDVGEIIRKHWSTIYSDEWFDKNDLIISLPGDYDKQEVVIDFKNRKEPYYLVNSNELKELKEDLKALGLKGLHIKTKIIKPSWEDRKYTEVLSISYIYDDEPRKEIHEAENINNKIYYFMVGICLDKNRPNAIKEDFADWSWTKIPYKLLDENWGVDKTKEEAVNWVKNYITDGVPGTFGIVTEATEPYEGFKEEIHNGNHNDMDWSDIQKGKLIYSAYKEDKNPESIKVIVDESQKLNESGHNYQNGEFIEPKWFKDKKLYNEFKKFVDSQLSDGAIDNPDYVNTLSPEEYESLLVNTWMKDQEEIDMFEEHIKNGYYGEKAKSLVESETEDYWDATELDRVGFMALLKFNNPEEHLNPSMQYIITNDGNEVYRFAMTGENERTKDIGAKLEFRKYINKNESEKLKDISNKNDILIMYNPSLKKEIKLIKKNNEWFDDSGKVFAKDVSIDELRSYFTGDWKRIMSTDESEKLKEAVELSYDDYYDFGNEDNEDELFCAQCGNPVKPDFCYIVDESDPHSEVYCLRCYEDLSSQGMLESDNFNAKKLNESISYASEKEIKDMTDEELEDYLKYLKDEMIYHTTKKKAEIEKEIEKITKILYDRDYYIDYSNPDVNTIKFDKDGNEITTKEDK